MGKTKKRLHATGHHLWPRSRGGGSDYVVALPQNVHLAWHLLFGNATWEEAQLLIEKYWSTPDVDNSVIIDRKCIGYFKR